MFDFVENQIIRIVLEVFALIVSFLGGIKYEKHIRKKQNKIGNINHSNINSISQENK